MAIPFLDVIGGLTDVSGQLLDLYKIRRDGSFFEQQSFLAELREREASVADEQSIKREYLLAALGSARAENDHDRQADSQHLQARLNVAVQREMQSDERHAKNAPYDLTDDELHGLVADATEGGRKPALLIAPFYNDEMGPEQADAAPPTFRVAIRRSWISSQWVDDVSVLDGLLSRPLRNTDLDRYTIRRALKDLPVILVHGEIQRGQRAWCSITAWNLAPPHSAQAIAVDLPPLPLPDLDGEIGQTYLDFEDALGRVVAVTVGLLSEWFHVTTHARVPRALDSLSRNGVDLREFGPGIAAAYDVAMASGVVDEFTGLSQQARLLSASGYNRTAIDLAAAAVDRLQSDRRPGRSSDLEILRSLAEMAVGPDDRELRLLVDSLVEEISRRYVYGFLNLDESG